MADDYLESLRFLGLVAPVIHGWRVTAAGVARLRSVTVITGHPVI